MKRVYGSATVSDTVGGVQVLLDGRPLRTPARHPLLVPSRPLAEAIAAEWQAQGPTVQPETMPLTQFASTAIDRVRPNRVAVVDAVVAYAETDLLCYRADDSPELAAREARCWQPLLDWAARRFDAALLTYTGIMPGPQPEAVCRALRHAIEVFDDMTLSALQFATASCGSLVVALALIEGRIDAAGAFEAAELEATFQIEQWGEDAEAARRRARLSADIAAARRFVDLLRA
jgi:chaperone required for assembly of F1-ATPase